MGIEGVDLELQPGEDAADPLVDLLVQVRLHGRLGFEVRVFGPQGLSQHGQRGLGRGTVHKQFGKRLVINDGQDGPS